MNETIEEQHYVIGSDKTNNIPNPIVSVIISTFRRKETLKKAMLSLVDQSYAEIEVIVVDDNANDNWNREVVKIIQKVRPLLDFELIYIKNEENKGSAMTRNIGISKASGEYITFLDDDDIYLPDKVKNQVMHMIESKSDYSITDIYLYNEADKLLEKRYRKYLKFFSEDHLFKYHLKYHMTGTDVMMFKKQYLKIIGGFPHINIGDEFYLMQKAIEGGGKFSYLPVCDVKAYVHTKYEGLSSGESKISGENDLYEHKKKYFDVLSSYDKRYIKMRHYAVLAFVELRRKRLFIFLKYGFKSLLSSPTDCLMLLIKRR
ncbi:glycosyltransferase [Paenibacillus sp. J5C_2022]|uniref:glycosyltransferase family 2 protein n=1 Tax=Paenibacillus sp. J5C2022 TaxID=2977129 RepID=UPI0021D2AD7E|nr:glycosyltransferase family 2 protein [Paenibacillus sp. J5C2022]MCU6708781.1 glycosyltransferase [Paenibacillus sp. J5C2022]